jgi:hypothetical protein
VKINLPRVCGKIAERKQGRLLLKKVGSLKFPSEKRESHKNHEELLHKALKVRIKFWKFIRQRMRSDQRIQNKIRWQFFDLVYFSLFFSNLQIITGLCAGSNGARS